MKTTIIYKEIELEIDFEYYSGSPMVMYYKDGTGHPGDDPEIEIQEILHKGEDIYELLEDNMSDLEELLWNYVSSVRDWIE